MKSNIAFFVSCLKGLNTGRGGHYYSLQTYIQALQNYGVDCVIINTGNKEIPNLREQFNEQYHLVNIGITNLTASLKLIEKILKEENINTIHFFDKPSSPFASYLSLKRNIGIVGTKCGGPISRLWYPKVSSLILFTQEDLKYFQSIKKFSASNLHLIPNRVQPFREDETRVKNLTRDYNINKGKTIILRICRIASQNKKSLEGLIELTRALNSNGIQTSYLIIGHVEDNEVLEHIKMLGDENLGQIITEEKYTKNAKELIPIADLVIGSGRSLMEASYFGKPLLFPSNDCRYPVLLTPNNFDEAFRKNFSYRTEVMKTEDEVLREIEKVVINENEYSKNSNFAEEIFKRWFNINSVTNEISLIQKEAKPSNFKLDIALGLVQYLFYKYR